MFEEVVKDFGAWSATPCDPGIDGGAASLTAELDNGYLVTIGFVDHSVFATVEDEDGAAVPGRSPLDLAIAPWSRNVLLAVVEAAAAAQGAPVAGIAAALDWIACARGWWCVACDRERVQAVAP